MKKTTDLTKKQSYLFIIIVIILIAIADNFNF